MTSVDQTPMESPSQQEKQATNAVIVARKVSREMGVLRFGTSGRPVPISTNLNRHQTSRHVELERTPNSPFARKIESSAVDQSNQQPSRRFQVQKIMISSSSAPPAASKTPQKTTASVRTHRPSIQTTPTPRQQRKASTASRQSVDPALVHARRHPVDTQSLFHTSVREKKPSPSPTTSSSSLKRLNLTIQTNQRPPVTSSVPVQDNALFHAMTHRPPTGRIATLPTTTTTAFHSSLVINESDPTPSQPHNEWRAIDTSMDRAFEDPPPEIVQMQVVDDRRLTKKRKSLERQRLQTAVQELQEQMQARARQQEERKRRKERVMQLAASIRSRNKPRTPSSPQHAIKQTRSTKPDKESQSIGSYPVRKPPVPRLSGRKPVKRRRKTPEEPTEEAEETDNVHRTNVSDSILQSSDMSADVLVHHASPREKKKPKNKKKKKKREEPSTEIKATPDEVVKRRALAREYMELQKQSRQFMVRQQQEALRQDELARRQKLEELERVRLERLRTSKKRKPKPSRPSSRIQREETTRESVESTNRQSSFLVHPISMANKRLDPTDDNPQHHIETQSEEMQENVVPNRSSDQEEAWQSNPRLQKLLDLELKAKQLSNRLKGLTQRQSNRQEEQEEQEEVEEHDEDESDGIDGQSCTMIEEESRLEELSGSEDESSVHNDDDVEMEIDTRECRRSASPLRLMRFAADDHEDEEQEQLDYASIGVQRIACVMWSTEELETAMMEHQAAMNRHRILLSESDSSDDDDQEEPEEPEEPVVDHVEEESDSDYAPEEGARPSDTTDKQSYDEDPDHQAYEAYKRLMPTVSNANESANRHRADPQLIAMIQAMDDSHSVIDMYAKRLWYAQEQKHQQTKEQPTESKELVEEHRDQEEQEEEDQDHLDDEPDQLIDAPAADEASAPDSLAYETLDSILQQVHDANSEDQPTEAPAESASTVAYWDQMVANTTPLQRNRSQDRVTIDVSELVAQQQQADAALEFETRARPHSPATLAKRLLAEVELHEAIHEAQLSLLAMETTQAVEQAQLETIQLATAFNEEMETNLRSHQLASEHAKLSQQFDETVASIVSQATEMQTQAQDDLAQQDAVFQRQLMEAQRRETAIQTEELAVNVVDVGTHAMLQVDAATAPMPMCMDAAVQYEAEESIEKQQAPPEEEQEYEEEYEDPHESVASQVQEDVQESIESQAEVASDEVAESAIEEDEQRKQTEEEEEEEYEEDAFTSITESEHTASRHLQVDSIEDEHAQSDHDASDMIPEEEEQEEIEEDKEQEEDDVATSVEDSVQDEEEQDELYGDASFDTLHSSAQKTASPVKPTATKEDQDSPAYGAGMTKSMEEQQHRLENLRHHVRRKQQDVQRIHQQLELEQTRKEMQQEEQQLQQEMQAMEAQFQREKAELEQLQATRCNQSGGAKLSATEDKEEEEDEKEEEEEEYGDHQEMEEEAHADEVSETDESTEIKDDQPESSIPSAQSSAIGYEDDDFASVSESQTKDEVASSKDDEVEDDFESIPGDKDAHSSIPDDVQNRDASYEDESFEEQVETAVKPPPSPASMSTVHDIHHEQDVDEEASLTKSMEQQMQQLTALRQQVQAKKHDTQVIGRQLHREEARKRLQDEAVKLQEEMKQIEAKLAADKQKLEEFRSGQRPEPKKPTTTLSIPRRKEEEEHNDEYEDDEDFEQHAVSDAVEKESDVPSEVNDDFEDEEHDAEEHREVEEEGQDVGEYEDDEFASESNVASEVASIVQDDAIESEAGSVAETNGIEEEEQEDEQPQLGESTSAIESEEIPVATDQVAEDSSVTEEQPEETEDDAYDQDEFDDDTTTSSANKADEVPASAPTEEDNEEDKEEQAHYSDEDFESASQPSAHEERSELIGEQTPVQLIAEVSAPDHAASVVTDIPQASKQTKEVHELPFLGDESVVIAQSWSMTSGDESFLSRSIEEQMKRLDQLKLMLAQMQAERTAIQRTTRSERKKEQLNAAEKQLHDQVVALEKQLMAEQQQLTLLQQRNRLERLDLKARAEMLGKGRINGDQIDLLEGFDLIEAVEPVESVPDHSKPTDSVIKNRWMEQCTQTTGQESDLLIGFDHVEDAQAVDVKVTTVARESMMTLENNGKMMIQEENEEKQPARESDTDLLGSFDYVEAVELPEETPSSELSAAYDYVENAELPIVAMVTPEPDGTIDEPDHQKEDYQQIVTTVTQTQEVTITSPVETNESDESVGSEPAAPADEHLLTEQQSNYNEEEEQESDEELQPTKEAPHETSALRLTDAILTAMVATEVTDAIRKCRTQRSTSVSGPEPPTSSASNDIAAQDTRLHSPSHDTGRPVPVTPSDSLIDHLFTSLVNEVVVSELITRRQTQPSVATDSPMVATAAAPDSPIKSPPAFDAVAFAQTIIRQLSMDKSSVVQLPQLSDVLSLSPATARDRATTVYHVIQDLVMSTDWTNRPIDQLQQTLGYQVKEWLTIGARMQQDLERHERKLIEQETGEEPEDLAHMTQQLRTDDIDLLVRQQKRTTLLPHPHHPLKRGVYLTLLETEEKRLHDRMTDAVLQELVETEMSLIGSLRNKE